MESADVVVVGAGPAGSTAAYHLARQGHRVLLAEEHERVGHPVQCAGLVSQRVLDLAQTRAMVLHEVRGATVWSPSLRPLTFKAPGTKAFVISRSHLDFLLAERAGHAGARVETGWKFRGLARPVPSAPDGAVEAEFSTEDGESIRVSSRLVIGADGVTSSVARAFRLRRPVEFLPAYEAEMPFPDGDPDQVEIYLGQSISPGLFGWWIPDGNGRARVGVAVSARRNRTARDYYGALCDQMAKRYGHAVAPPIEIIVAGIPIGQVPRTSGDHVMLVGDAAGQVKPLSGGGIFTGMRCAEMAAAVANRALRSKDVSANTLSSYDRAWRAELGPEMDRAMTLRRIFLRMSDEKIERLLRVMEDTGMLATVVAFGDIDFPTIAVGKLLRQSPSLVRLVPSAVSAVLRRGPSSVPDLDDPEERRGARIAA